MGQMTPIRILHVVRAGQADGGMENGLVNLANRLDGRFVVSICALDAEESFSKKIQRTESAFFCLPPRAGGIDWRLVPRLVSLIRRERIDIVHSHNWGTFLYAVVAGRMARAAVIHGEHGKNFAELAEEGRSKRLAKKWLGARADLILSVCEDIRKEWLARYGLEARHIRTIVNGVDSAHFRPAPSNDAKRALGLPPDSFVAGTVGRLDPIKNQAALIGAIALLARDLPHVHAVLIGGGPLEHELRRQVESLALGERVHFAGVRRDVEAVLPALDVFVLPSISEGMSNVLLEAMSCGIPPVCADLPSHREIVTPGVDAVLLDPCDAPTLADALRELERNPGKRARLGAAARTTVVERFTIDRMVREYQDTYLEVLSRKRKR